MPRTKPRDLPERLVTGTYILHEGLGKWNADPDRAAGLHASASAAFPMLRAIQPKHFVKLLSAAEISVGTVLLVPAVPTALAGLALTGFAGGLVTLYLRTPAMRKPGSLWPSAAGIAVSKDSWLLAIGVGLLMDGVGRSGRERRRVARAVKRAAAAAEQEPADQG